MNLRIKIWQKSLIRILNLNCICEFDTFLILTNLGSLAIFEPRAYMWPLVSFSKKQKNLKKYDIG